MDDSKKIGLLIKEADLLNQGKIPVISLKVEPNTRAE